MSRKSIVKSRDKIVNTCFSKKRTKPEYLTALSGCSNDLADVSVLPKQWIPKKSGTILSNYLHQREQSHQSFLLELLKDTRTLNEEINGKVRSLAEFLLAEIRKNQRDIDCVVQKVTPSEKVLSLEDRAEALVQVKNLLSRRIQELTTFKLEAFGLERDRASRLKSILRMCFQRLVSVGHKCPKDLLHEFDERIYDINQQIISNYRTYIVLEAKLRCQADESLINARSLLNQMVFVIKKTHRSQSAFPWLADKQYLNAISNIHDNKQNLIDLNHQDYHSQSKLFEEYKEAVFKMLIALSDIFDNLYKEVKDYNNFTRECGNSKITEFQNIIENAVCFLGFRTISNDVNLNSSFGKISRSDVLNMQKSLSAFGENFKNTYLLLHDAVHVWDTHMVRLALAQKLTMASVEDLIVNNDAIELANEVVINIAIEQLRAAPEADKLQQYYEVVEVTLNRTTDVYTQHSELEVSKLEEFIKFDAFLINVLLAELNLFIENNPKSLSEVKSSISTPVTGSPKTAGLSSRELLSKAIFQTEVQNVAICKLRNGFLESYENNLPTLSVQLNQQIQLWVDERIDILHVRHSLKLISHSIRPERIRMAREIRLAEIRFHESRLNSHLDAIYDLVDNLPMEASEMLSLDAPELYPLGRWLLSIQTNMTELLTRGTLDPETKRLKMRSYAARLVKHRQQFSASLDLAMEQYKKRIEYRIQVARISNVRFISQLQLFCEGGKYAAAEALKTCTALVRGAEALEACFSRTLDCVHQRRTQLLSLADQQILPLQKVVDEALKNVPKGFLDKQKIASAKK